MKLLLAHSASAVAHVLDVARAAQQRGAGAQGSQRHEVVPLATGLVSSVSGSRLPEQIVEIARFVPGIHLEIREWMAAKLVDLLLKREINSAMVGDMQRLPAYLDGAPQF